MSWIKRLFGKKKTTKQCDIPVVMHWVVCKEELPKKEGNYLINWDGLVLEAEFYKEDKIWISEEGLLYENVTHWMYLPKPPCA